MEPDGRRLLPPPDGDNPPSPARSSWSAAATCPLIGGIDGPPRPQQGALPVGTTGDDGRDGSPCIRWRPVGPGLDLRSFRVVARRLRRRSQLSRNRLETVTPGGVFGRFLAVSGDASIESVCSRPQAGVETDNTHGNLQGIAWTPPASRGSGRASP